MYKFSNIYVLAAFGTIGGALFGFDVSSMSAWIDTPQYMDYFNSPNSTLQGGVSSISLRTKCMPMIVNSQCPDHRLNVRRLIHWCDRSWFHR